MKTRKLIVFALMSMIFLCGGAFGQAYKAFRDELREIGERARFKIGPFRIHPVLNFRDIGYDDNVYYRPVEKEPVSDFMGIFSPEAKVYLLFRERWIFSFTENPEFHYYLKEENLRAFTHSFSPGIRYLFLNRFVVSADYHSNTRRRRFSSEIDSLVRDSVKGYNLSLFYETPRKTSFGLSAAFDRVTFEDVILPGFGDYLSRALNRKERSVRFEFFYQVLPESYFFWSLGTRDYDFEDAQSIWRNSSSYHTYIGLRFPERRRVRGAFSIGYKKFIPVSKEMTPFSGFVGEGDLEFRPGRIGFRAGFFRDIFFSYWTDVLYFLEDGGKGGVFFYPVPFIKVEYTYQYGRTNYPEPVRLLSPDGSPAFVKRKDNNRTHSLGAAFRLFGETGLGISLNHLERSSNIPDLNMKRMFIGAYLTHRF